LTKGREAMRLMDVVREIGTGGKQTRDGMSWKKEEGRGRKGRARENG
jgi:hypothetical protein